MAQYLDAMLRRLEAGRSVEAGELRRGAEVMRDALHRTTDLIQHLRGLTRRTVRPLSGVDPYVLLDDLQALPDIGSQQAQDLIQGITHATGKTIVLLNAAQLSLSAAASRTSSLPIHQEH